MLVWSTPRRTGGGVTTSTGFGSAAALGATPPAMASSDARCGFIGVHPSLDPGPQGAGFIAGLAVELGDAAAEANGIYVLHPLHHDRREHAEQGQRPRGVGDTTGTAGRAAVEHEGIGSVEPGERGECRTRRLEVE